MLIPIHFMKKGLFVQLVQIVSIYFLDFESIDRYIYMFFAVKKGWDEGILGILLWR